MDEGFGAELGRSRMPPPLPPRGPSFSQNPSLVSTPMQSTHYSRTGYSLSAPDAMFEPPIFDPQPLADSSNMKRKLLLVYIHGFMGNETSFQSFPAHLHNLLSVTLEDLGWGVHTKVYPKFKTRHNISVATEDFSAWLSRFECVNTDIVLLGHSMGGLLAAEVVLLRDATGRRRHRILGTISFDSPFLGIHPGVISAGLGSIFRPDPKSPGEDEHAAYTNENPSTASLSTVHSGTSVDEFFDKKPQRNFTIVQSKQEGTWNSALKFINKYHSRLTAATGQYLMSHLEFGGCLADPAGLKKRYNTIRNLETGEQTPDGQTIRVRFLNYYTSSTGRLKNEPKPAPAAAHPEHSFDLADEGVEGIGGGDLQDMTREMHRNVEHARAGTGGHRRNSSSSTFSSSGGEMTQSDPDPISGDEAFYDAIPGTPGASVPIIETTVVDPEPPAPDHPPPPIPILAPLPGIQPPPEKPAEFDYSQIPDPTVRKAAEKAAAKAMKLWDNSMREYEKAVKGWERSVQRGERKMMEKQRKLETQRDEEIERLHQEKLRMEKEERRMKGIPELGAVAHTSPTPSTNTSLQSSTLATPSVPPSSPSLSYPHSPSPPPEPKEEKKKRKRKFCLIPRTPDPCWVKVEMTGVDEVGAHCGLFFLGDVYERLVGDVAGRLEGWVGEESSRRVAEMIGGGMQGRGHSGGQGGGQGEAFESGE